MALILLNWAGQSHEPEEEHVVMELRPGLARNGFSAAPSEVVDAEGGPIFGKFSILQGGGHSGDDTHRPTGYRHPDCVPPACGHGAPLTGPPLLRVHPGRCRLPGYTCGHGSNPPAPPLLHRTRGLLL